MKRMLLFLTCFLTVVLYASNIEGGFNTKDFPQVSFLWHENNPAPMSMEDFQLFEDGQQVDFTMKVQPPEYGLGNNRYVILWEDMAVYNKYHHFYELTKQVLLNFVDSTDFRKGDMFYVSAYNRTATTENTLKPLIQNFTSDRDSLKNAINSYQPNKESFRDKYDESDAFPALNEALDILSKQNNAGAKTIILFTVGHALENSATNSVVAVQFKAQELHIPIYIINYAAPYGKSQKFQEMALSTYGKIAIVNSKRLEENIDFASKSLCEMYKESEQRYYGCNYLFAYNSSAVRGGDATLLMLKAGRNDFQMQMLPPPHNFVSWIKANKVLAIALLALVVSAIAVLVLVLVKRSQKQRMQMQQLCDQQEKAAKEAQASAEAFEKYKRQEDQQRKYRQQQQMQNDLAKLMRTKNLFPKLYCSVDKENFVYQITKPTTTLGRETDNDMVINHETISRHHATILFTGVDFQIKDDNSKNGIFVNGKIVQGVQKLRDQDVINIGKAIISYHQ